jgi:hypothetical protein
MKGFIFVLWNCGSSQTERRDAVAKDRESLHQVRQMNSR